MPQQERAVRTHRRILEAAAKVFCTHGYTAASMTEILEQAQVSKGGFYFHFDSKESLAKAVMDEQRRFARVSASTGSPLQDAINLTQGVARDLQANVMVRAALRLTIEHGTFTAPHPGACLVWIRPLSELLDRALTQGELRPGTDAAAAAEVIVCALSGMHALDHILTGQHRLGHRIGDLWRLLLPGIAKDDRLPGLVPEGTLPGEV